MQWNYNDRVFNNCSSLAQIQRVVTLNFLLSFAFSAIKVSDFIQVWANYSVGAALLTRDALSFFPVQIYMSSGKCRRSTARDKTVQPAEVELREKSKSHKNYLYDSHTREFSRARPSPTHFSAYNLQRMAEESRMWID